MDSKSNNRASIFSTSEGDKIVIPVWEESLDVSKTIEESGQIRLIKSVEERQENVRLSLNEEKVSVNRVAINKYIEEPPKVRQEGSITIYPVLKEVLVVQKKLLLVEEIHITKHIDTQVVDEVVTLRQESVKIERDSPSNERPDLK